MVIKEQTSLCPHCNYRYNFFTRMKRYVNMDTRECHMTNCLDAERDKWYPVWSCNVPYLERCYDIGWLAYTYSTYTETTITALSLSHLDAHFYLQSKYYCTLLLFPPLRGPTV